MQDPASDISEKMTGNDNANIVKKPCSEDFVNNNKENDRDGKKWMLNPLRVSGNLFQDRRLSDERSNRESEDKTSDSEENDKSSPGPEDIDLNMNRERLSLFDRQHHHPETLVNSVSCGYRVYTNPFGDPAGPLTPRFV